MEAKHMNSATRSGRFIYDLDF